MDADSRRSKRDYRGFTQPTGVLGKLRDLDFATLAPGDLGVTANGFHVMVYLRSGRWMHADPTSLKVTFRDPANDRNPWFDSIVVMQRWTVLETGGKDSL